jgi:hypothetical protein
MLRQHDIADLEDEYFVLASALKEMVNQRYLKNTHFPINKHK